MTRTGLALAAAAALVLLVAIVGSLITDERQPQASPTVGNGAENGLIAYSYAGDIYVGDPATGETTAIVTHPRYEVNPVFSPDGERIAFIRGGPFTEDAMIVVVRADGSDERVILPKGREHRGIGGLVWTPDGGSLVVQVDRPPFELPYGDGELSLFDSFGSGTEEVLTPPLTPTPGGHYFSTNDQVAPMFRPPAGDRILAGDWSEIRVFDRDLTTSTRLGSDVLKRYEPFFTHVMTWSPDGTRIAIHLSRYEAPSDYAPLREGTGLFVMSGEGDELRRIGEGFPWQWSPDSSRVAFERERAETDRAVIVVADLESGKKRSLESTSAAGKDGGARFSTLTDNKSGHHWYYEGWRW